MYPEHLERAFKDLDRPCWQCGGSGRFALNSPTNDCDVCYGTGYQPTGAGIELLNFLRRQHKRIERESV